MMKTHTHTEREREREQIKMCVNCNTIPMSWQFYFEQLTNTLKLSKTVSTIMESKIFNGFNLESNCTIGQTIKKSLTQNQKFKWLINGVQCVFSFTKGNFFWQFTIIWLLLLLWL
jgi:hypothetical protein